MKLLKLILGFFMIFLLACEKQADLAPENEKLKAEVSKLESMVSKMRASDDKLIFLSSKLNGIKARIVTDYGNIEVKFFPEVAPIQCFNFITRSESGYYDNTLFHRVVKGFMIQGGDPNTKTGNKSSYGQGGPIAMIPHEFNEKSHKRGILSTARTSDVNMGAGSQFFIMHGDNSGLNNQYTVFGEVTKGMEEVVDKIADLKTVSQMAINPAKIITIEVYK
jgi:peptidyl-prolyl cis-trans isomerase B (cyclophilin B)